MAKTDVLVSKLVPNIVQKCLPCMDHFATFNSNVVCNPGGCLQSRNLSSHEINYLWGSKVKPFCYFFVITIVAKFQKNTKNSRRRKDNSDSSRGGKHETE